MRRTIDLKDLRGRTIDEVLCLDNELGIIFTDGSKITMELELVERGWPGCDTCDHGSTPDVYEIVAREEV